MSVTVPRQVIDPEVAGFVETVGSDGPVAVVGGRTRWDLGGPAHADVRLVEAPTGIIEYIPEEMIVRVRAGTPVAEVHAALAEHGQRTALPERGGTVGGALVAGENDIAALGRGLLRDALLQVRYVSADATLVTGGGPTVKNVTGFDLPRLMVGSLGTLGLVAEAIIRTNPIPPLCRWLRSDDCDPSAARASVLAPSTVLWDGTSTWVQLEGHAPDVEAETKAMIATGHFTEVEGAPELPPHRWSLPPAELVNSAAAYRSGDAAVAVIGLGLAFSDVPQPDRPQDAAMAIVSDRMKQIFDPTGRLNPGRQPGRS